MRIVSYMNEDTAPRETGFHMAKDAALSSTWWTRQHNALHVRTTQCLLFCCLLVKAFLEASFSNSGYKTLQLHYNWKEPQASSEPCLPYQPCRNWSTETLWQSSMAVLKISVPPSLPPPPFIYFTYKGLDSALKFFSHFGVIQHVNKKMKSLRPIMRVC